MLIRRVTPSDVSALQRIQTIYTESISATERKPLAWLHEIVERADYSVYVAILKNDVIGFAILFLPRDEKMALLEYFAMDAPHRSRGFGSEFLVQIIASVEDRCVIAEVDAEDGTEPNARRQAFYRRLGFKRVAGLRYRFPLGSSPPPMDLFLFRQPNLLNRAVLVRWLQSVYQQVYEVPPSDPRLASMISELSDPVRLE